MANSQPSLLCRLFTALALCLCLLPCLHAQNQSPYLFFGQEDIPGLQSRLNSETGRLLLQRLDTLCLPAPAPQPAWKLAHQSQAFALRFLLIRRPEDAAAAFSLAEAALASQATEPSASPKSPGLSPLLAKASLLGALAGTCDLARQAWPEEKRKLLSERLLHQAQRSSASIRPDLRPVDCTLETLALQAASGLCAAVLSQENGNPDAAKALSLRCQSFFELQLRSFPEKSWLVEGFPSLRQALAHGLGAYLCFLSRNGKASLVQPSARHLAALYCFATSLPPSPQATASAILPGIPPAPSPTMAAEDWAGAPDASGDMASLLCLGDAATHDALLWVFERCFGPVGNQSLDIRKGGDALFALLAACTDYPSTNPARSLPRSWQDPASGTLIFRNRWHNAQDIIFTLTANSAHSPASPGFADAGSFRLTGLGTHWITQRAQDEQDLTTASRARENVPYIQGTNGWPSGKLEHARRHPDGSGSALLRLDRCYCVAPAAGEKGARNRDTLDLGIRARRSFAIDFSGNSGAPALLLIGDEIIKGPPRRWLLHTPEKNVRLLPNGFELVANSGASLHVSFVTPRAPRISIQEGRYTNTLSIEGPEHFLVLLSLVPPGTSHPRVSWDQDSLNATLRAGKAVLRLDDGIPAVR